MPLIRGDETQMDADRKAHFRLYAIGRKDTKNLLEGYMHREGPVDRVAPLEPKPPAHNGLELLKMKDYGGVVAFAYCRKKAAKNYADAVKDVLSSAGYTSVTTKLVMAYARDEGTTRFGPKPIEAVYLVRVTAKW